MDNKNFPNGFDSWQETHYEIAGFINVYLHKWMGNPNGSAIVDRYAAQGTGGMYELAEEWTDEFEELHKDRIWDGEYFDEIEKFLNNKNKNK